ncbi:MAG: Gfo/Idh/MocA family oxidoreductase [Planctomycetes bacterium]|nr:Gfo/Idh/MocA family oxidoreductase [Planctomycetota bacterium]
MIQPNQHDATSEHQLGVGVIGCGGFGLFALQQFVQVPGVRLAGMAATARPAALAAAQRYGLEDVVDVQRLLDLPEVDLVYISTPPFLHYEQARLALEAGKHVVCEKPLALTVEQADQLVALARSRDRLLVANLMQRYNPVFEIVSQLIDRRPLGEFLHGYFENYACDENLPPEHWFWDRQKSGGIFIEHGVHFFDLAAGWLGPGEVVAAHASRRSDGCEDQVQCTMRFANGAHFNFYHGFHQPGRLDRQELRLVFEQGDLLLHGWVPTSVRVHAVADESQTRQLCELFSGARVDALTTYGPRDRRFYSHGREHDVYQQFELHWGEGRQKIPVYCDLLRRMLADQIAWIRDHRHTRKITEQNGRDSVAMACAADRLAHSEN